MSLFEPWLSWTTAMDVAAAAASGREAVARWRQRRLADLLDAAARRSPFYRRLLAGRDTHAADLARLPVMNKRTLMARFDEWVTDPALRLEDLRRFVCDSDAIGAAYLGRYTVWESSGSSGEPCIFVQDARAMAVYDALEALRRPPLTPLRRWLDPCFQGERIAFVGATNGHFASTVSMERLKRLNPWLSAHLHSVSFLQPTPALVDELHRLQPTILSTYPSAAVLLAEERLAGRLSLDIREVWTGGEDLSERARALVRSAFHCPVANSYGASEFLTLAFECRHGHLHLNDDWAILESVDREGRAVPNGSTGATVLLTNLANHVQPLIRYDLGDRVTLDARACPCGSHFPTLEVQGRCDDTLRLGRRRQVSVLPLALSTVLESEAALFDFQLLQEGPCELLLRSGSRDAGDTAALERGRRALEAFLQGQGAGEVQIRCDSAPLGPCGRSGKRQRVIAAPLA
ncbi:phenylacetate--CoA ligase family protein [Variovorax sp. JS1663]|uniref:phenylacetate--CoA ligase family protein n=1 Tax=Variovorax sp. JS1663 TaxID=1851577 RepID=UPI000B3471EB|nr:AMP-binding protein [Variovorax sp. JS1663]OUM00913.1 hypothetical protein A8M77_18575 [Variovorax sp. JS1663]